MQTGLDVFLAKDYKKYKGLRLGILCNQASLTDKNIHIRDIVISKKPQMNVTAFFGPQHGVRGEKQDNMVESDDFRDPVLNIPVYSLYSTTRKPTDAMMDNIDAFVVDLQDIGTRIYTFMYTLAYCMQGAKRTGKKVIVLDRPNPIDGVHIEGNVLEPKFSSFVGLYPICVRHGMTMGELALMFNEAFGIGCDLEVIKIKGWKPASFAWDWKRDWVPPSPNIPNPWSALTFPGNVLFEGTNISEARGTTRPFEWVGAPYINSDELAREMNAKKIPGIYFRPIYFQPTYQKWKDQVCGGVHHHVTDPKKFNSFKAGIHLLAAIAKLYRSSFAWKKPPYEYENEKMPIDCIAGTDKLRLAIDAGSDLRGFEEESAKQLAEFKKIRKEYLIYKR